VFWQSILRKAQRGDDYKTIPTRKVSALIRRPFRAVFSAVSVFMVSFGVGSSGAAYSQTPSGVPTFEVASVKSNAFQPREGESRITDGPNSFIARKATLEQLIQWAYDLKSFQIDR